ERDLLLRAKRTPAQRPDDGAARGGRAPCAAQGRPRARGLPGDRRVAYRLHGLHGPRAGVPGGGLSRRRAPNPQYARDAESPALKLMATIVELWDFPNPAKSESRFRGALADASGDWRLEL